MESFSVMMACPLFAGMTATQLAAFLGVLLPTSHSFGSGETLLAAGERVHSIGILLEGRAEAQKTTTAGRPFTVARLNVGSVFGDVLSGSGGQSPVNITATSACRSLHLPYARLFSAAFEKEAPQHSLFLQNLLRVISEKYFALDERLDLLLTRSLRQRISTWLLAEAARRGTNHFSTTHTRASLAAYLGCERSALSREISRMAKEGLLSAQRGHFLLLQPNNLRISAEETRL